MNFNEIGLKDLVLDFDSNDLQDITIVQGDTKTRGFKVLVSTNNGEIIKASSQYEMRLYGINSNYPDKSFFTKGTIDGDFYKVYISTDMASKSGKLQLQLALFEGKNALIQSRIKEVDVYRSIANGGNVGKDLVVDFTKLQEALDRVDVQEKKYDKSLVRQASIESNVNKKHTEVVQIRDGLKGVLNTENARVEAEKKRVSAENTRVSQEKTRQQNENTRQSQEKTRQSQEKQRVEAEKLRQSQEQSRIEAESKRATSESARNQSEKTRSTKEAERQNAEKDRATQEDTRKKQENARVEAEKQRAKSESDRAGKFDSWDKTMSGVIPTATSTVAGIVRIDVDGESMAVSKKTHDEDIKKIVNNLEGRNYLLNSDKEVNSSNYTVQKYKLSKGIQVGQRYTLTIWGKLNEQKQSFNAYNSGGSIGFGPLKKVKDGVYQLGITWSDKAKNSAGNLVTADNTELWIYQQPQSPTVPSTINKIKLEKGEIGTDWTPAPEDFATKTDLDLKVDKKHTHSISDVTNLQTTLDKKINVESLIDFGGRNLLKDSDNLNGWTKYDGGKHTVTNEFMEDFKIQGRRIKSDAGNSTDFIKSYINLDCENLLIGKIYTFSVYIKNNRDVKAQIRVQGFDWNFAYELQPSECKRFVVTGKRGDITGQWTKIIQFQLRGSNKTDYVDMTVSRPQLEEGNVATSWSKNLSDFQSDIADLTKNVDTKVSSDNVNNIAIIENGASTTSIPANTLIFEKE